MSLLSMTLVKIQIYVAHISLLTPDSKAALSEHRAGKPPAVCQHETGCTIISQAI